MKTTKEKWNSGIFLMSHVEHVTVSRCWPAWYQDTSKYDLSWDRMLGCISNKLWALSYFKYVLLALKLKDIWNSSQLLLCLKSFFQTLPLPTSAIRTADWTSPWGRPLSKATWNSSLSAPTQAPSYWPWKWEYVDLNSSQLYQPCVCT